MSQSLSSQQTARCVATGVALWLMAAFLIRFAGAILFEPGDARLLGVLGACVLLAIPTVQITLWCGGAPVEQVLPAVVFMTLTALLLDGVAIMWFPALYGLAPDRLYLAAATLLWAVGVVLGTAALWRRRATTLSSPPYRPSRSEAWASHGSEASTIDDRSNAMEDTGPTCE